MKNKAQSFMEYSLLIGCIALALFAMQAYFKRGIQGVVKASNDDLGSPAGFDADGQQIYGSSYKAPDGQSNLVYKQITPLNTVKDQEIVTTELARGERSMVINRDVSTTQEAWQQSYEMKEANNYQVAGGSGTKDAPDPDGGGFGGGNGFGGGGAGGR